MKQIKCACLAMAAFFGVMRVSRIYPVWHYRQWHWAYLWALRGFHEYMSFEEGE